MSVSFNHSNEKRLTGGGISSITLSISAAAGQLAVVCGFPSGGSSSTPVNSITDNGSGNTWAIPGDYSGNMATYTGGSGAFIAYCNVGSGFTSITVNIPTASELTVCCGVWIGAKTSFPLRQATDGTNPSISLSVLGGGLCVGAANTSSGTSISGLATLTTDHGNMAGYGLAGSNENVTFSWSPSQNAPAVFAEFLAAPPSHVTIYGTATLHDAESMNPNALSVIAPTATLHDAEALTAVSGANPQVAFSAVQPDQNDPHGIPLQHGLTTYHWPLTTSTQYDYWMSLQDGQLGAGLYNAARNSGLTVTQSVPKWTDSGSKTLGMVRSYSATASATMTNPGAGVAVTGASVSVVVTGSNATIQVVTVFDMQATAVTTMIGHLHWNGVDQTAQAVFVSTASGQRACVSQVYTITGITAGSYTAALFVGATGNGQVNSGNTGFNLLLIDM